MEIEMTRVLTISRELEDAINSIAEIFPDESDFTTVCCAIANRDDEVEICEGWIKINVKD